MYLNAQIVIRQRPRHITNRRAAHVGAPGWDDHIILLCRL
jgi:hypothetical protein